MTSPEPGAPSESSKPKSVSIKSIVGLVFLVLALAVAAVFVRRSQELRRSASELPAGLQNPGFETAEDITPPKVAAAGWTRGGDNWADYYSTIVKKLDNPDYNPVYDSTADGNYLYMYSSSAIPEAEGWMRYEQGVSLEAGEYTLSAKAKVLLDQGRGVSALLADTANQTVLGSNLNFYQQNPPVWEGKAAVFTVPAAGDYFVRLFTNDGSQAYWDDVSLVKISVPTPTLTPSPSPSPTLTLTPTPTGTITPTPTPTPTLTPTLTPTPTLTLTPTLTPTVTLTPTPTIPPAGQLTFKLRLQGIISQGNDRTINLLIRDADGEEVSWDILSYADTNGVYSATIDNSELEAGSYDMLFKGPSHLRKKFADVQYNGGSQVFDFSQNRDDELWAGDVTGDNVIDLSDFDDVIDKYDFPQAPAASDEPADINADGWISIADVALSLLHIDIASWVEGDN